MQQCHYGILTGQSVEDPLAHAPALDERGATKKLQVSGCVRHCQSGPAGEVFDAPLPLTEMFEQFEPMGVTERLGDLGEADEHALFGTEA